MALSISCTPCSASQPIKLTAILLVVFSDEWNGLTPELKLWRHPFSYRRDFLCTKTREREILTIHCEEMRVQAESEETLWQSLGDITSTYFLQVFFFSLRKVIGRGYMASPLSSSIWGDSHRMPLFELPIPKALLPSTNPIWSNILHISNLNFKRHKIPRTMVSFEFYIVYYRKSAICTLYVGSF